MAGIGTALLLPKCNRCKVRNAVFCNTSSAIIVRVNNLTYMGNNFQYVLETLCFRKYNN